MAPYPADNVVVIRQVGLAVLAAVDTVRIQVDVVSKTHFGARLGGRLSIVGGVGWRGGLEVVDVGCGQARLLVVSRRALNTQTCC